VDDEKLYEVLGLPPGCSTTKITRAYRRLARRLHPDVTGDPGAAERFAALTQAYQRLVSGAQSATPRSAPVRVRRGGPAGRPVLFAGPVHIAPLPQRRPGGEDG
jgi:hypothetical protein